MDSWTTVANRHRSGLLAVREPSIPEHATVPSSVQESNDLAVAAILASAWQQAGVYDTPRIEPSSSSQYFIGISLHPTLSSHFCMHCVVRAQFLLLIRLLVFDPHSL